MHHEHDDAHQGDEAGEGLPRSPGEDPVQRIDVGVGPCDDPSLVGSVEIVEREALDVLEDGQAQVVHGPLARLDGGADLNDGETPSQQQVGQVEPAEDEDFAGGGGFAERCGGPTGTDNGGQCVVDAVLDESWSDECGRGGQEGEGQVGVQGPAIGPGVREEPLEQ